MSKYKASSHTTYNIGYHIVFCPKYRFNLLRHSSAERLKKMLYEKSYSLHITIPTMEVMPDHMHLFICAPPSLAIHTIIRELKGYTSYRLCAEYAYLRRYPSLWTRSYFVETVGHISESTVVQYIKNQKTAPSHLPAKARRIPGRIS